MRISDWSSDVCSSDLPAIANPEAKPSTQVSKPVASKPAVRKPAENKAATTVASKSTPWWISSGNGKGLQVIYVGSAAFERAIVVMGNAPFANEIGRASCRDRVCQLG